MLLQKFSNENTPCRFISSKKVHNLRQTSCFNKFISFYSAIPITKCQVKLLLRRLSPEERDYTNRFGYTALDAAYARLNIGNDIGGEEIRRLLESNGLHRGEENFAETKDGSEPNADCKLVVQQKGILHRCEVLQEGSPVLQQHSHKPGQFTETLDTRGLSLISLRLPSVGQYNQTLHYICRGEERPLFDFI